MLVIIEEIKKLNKELFFTTLRSRCLGVLCIKVVLKRLGKIYQKTQRLSLSINKVAGFSSTTL